MNTIRNTGKSRMIRERGRARQSATRTADKRNGGQAHQRNGGQAYTLDKMFGCLLIHHFIVIIPCLLISEMCGPDPPQSQLPRMEAKISRSEVTSLHLTPFLADFHIGFNYICRWNPPFGFALFHKTDCIWLAFYNA